MKLHIILPVQWFCEIFIDALLCVRAFVHLLMWVSSTQPIHNTQQMRIKLFSLRHLNDLGFSYVMERKLIANLANSSE